MKRKYRNQLNFFIFILSLDLFSKRIASSTPIFKHLHKCTCPADKVWYMDECQEKNTKIQALVGTLESEVEVIDTKSIELVDIGEVNCPIDFLNITLPGKSFALRTFGELYYLKYGLSIDHSMYCVEHLFNNDNHEVFLEVHLCLRIPSVPKCCPEDPISNLQEESFKNETTKFSIPFSVGTYYFETEAKIFPNIIKCKENETSTSVALSMTNDEAALKLTNEGLVLSHQVSAYGEKVFIPSPEYCVHFENKNLMATYCFEDPISTHTRNCKGASCIRKCCPQDEIFDMDNFRCSQAKGNERWTPKIYNAKNLDKYIANYQSFKIIVGFPINCETFLLQSTNDPPDVFKLLMNGSLYVENFKSSLLPYSSHQYCLDNFKYDTLITEEALVCVLEEVKETTMCNHAESVLYPIMVLISCVAIIITLFVYAMIPDLHAKVQGKCLIASISSLVAGYISMVVVQLSSSSLTFGWCITFGLLMQFSLLASFFWLNVMSFDIWRTLGSMKSGRKSKASARRRYFLYSLYGWGCPSLISLVTITMQFIPKTKSDLIFPRIGETDCFFPRADKRPWWIYLYGYISATLIINTVIFVHLSIILFRAKQISEAALGKKNQIHMEWAKLYLKLFLIMGITWIFEVASWIEGSCELWIITDIINSLRGLLIFIIFVCKRDILRKLLSRSTPAFNRMRTTMQSSIFSRSSKRTSNFYIDPSTNAGTQDVSSQHQLESTPVLADVHL